MAEIKMRTSPIRVVEPRLIQTHIDITLSAVRRVSGMALADAVRVTLVAEEPRSGEPPADIKAKALRVLHQALREIERWQPHIPPD